MRIVTEAIECDSCRQEIPVGDFDYVRVRLDYSYRDSEQLDLCARCVDRVMSVMNNPRAALTLEAVEFESPLRVDGRPPR